MREVNKCFNINRFLSSVQSVSASFSTRRVTRNGGCLHFGRQTHSVLMREARDELITSPR
jgi:hypothetical protein